MAIAQNIIDKIKAGATVRVFETYKEGGKDRQTRFEGLVLGRKHGNEPGASFTVRSTIQGVGVEKVFPIHSPSTTKIEILSSPRKVSRSKIYYVRDISRRAIRQKTTGMAQAVDKPEAKAETKSEEKK